MVPVAAENIGLLTDAVHVAVCSAWIIALGEHKTEMVEGLFDRPSVTGTVVLALDGLKFASPE
jgi:hypothetical protein